MLVLAGFMGGVAVYLARDWLQRQVQPPLVTAAPAAPATTMTTVVVARLPLHFGDEINRENLRVINWPADAVPEGTFQTLDELLAGTERRVALRDIGVNELMLKTRVSGFGGRATLSAIIDKDMRAVTIRVNDILGVAGFVLPGDRVDVLFTRPEDPAAAAGKHSQPITDILLQNVKVLAVDQVADSQKDKPLLAKAVTLEVSTDDAQRLILAAQVGNLALTLRNTGNGQTAVADTITIGTLLSRSRPVPAGAAPASSPPAPSYSVRIVRGVAASTQEVVPEVPVLPVPSVAAAVPAARKRTGSAATGT